MLDLRTKAGMKLFALLSSDRHDFNAAGRAFVSFATGNIFVQRALILRGGWHQPLMGPLTAHLISVFAARAPACAFILCFIAQVASGILRSYSNPDSLSHFVARAPARAFILRFIGRVILAFCGRT